MADLYVALVHHPVYDKNHHVVTTAVTNMDVHDIGRLSRTFGVRAFFVCTPVPTLHRLVRRIIRHWETGPGSTYNATRKEALSLVRIANDLDGAIIDVERSAGELPFVVATSAKDGPSRITFDALRAHLASPRPPVLLVLGTGWGLTETVLERANAILEPIRGSGDYNHLSVRSAAAIMLDRVRSGR